GRRLRMGSLLRVRSTCGQAGSSGRSYYPVATARGEVVGVSRFAFGMIIALAAMWVSVTASAATSPWKVVATPSPSTQANYLTAVITLNSNDAWAVGAWYRPTTSTPG